MNITLYIDAANIILSAQDDNIDLDILKLIDYLRRKYLCTKVVYFTARFSFHKKLYEQLNCINVEIIFKESYREKSVLKANCDVEISHYITIDVENNRVNEIILASGDGDFGFLLDYAKTKLNNVRCFSVSSNHTSRILKSKSYLKIHYLTDILHLLNEKAPI